MYTVINNIIKSHFKRSGKTDKGVYILLYNAVKTAIENGEIPDKTVMPPTRMLAEELSMSRSTVVKAYEMLTESRYLKSRQGAGHTVVAVPQGLAPAQTEQQGGYPEISELGKSFLHNIHLLNSSGEGVAFTPGLPPLDVFPIGQWQKLTNLYWRNIKSSELNYTISSGLDSLKVSIANYLLLSRNIKCDHKNIVIVAGSLQSLYLLGSVLVDKGNAVCLENPTFPNVISIFQSLQAKVLPVETDENGLMVSQLASELHKSAKLVHTTPSNQYPTGGKMSLQRRLDLLKWAGENNALIIENDYEHEINNWEKPIESIFSLDREQRTIYLGTFNRILHPSIRLGYMIVPSHLLPAVKALQMHSHRFVPQSIQVVMNDFMNRKLLYKHIKNAIEEAEVRRKSFVSLFKKHFAEEMELRQTDTLSFHLLADIKNGVQDEALCARLEAGGVIAHPLSKCYVDETNNSGLILGYSSVSKAFMTSPLLKMAGVFHGMH
ncbi:MAG: PLP-dependent aminotransferase family protein [Bacteroidota bacterium]